MFEARIDLSQIEGMATRTGKTLDRVALESVNRTLRRGKTRFVDTVADELNLRRNADVFKRVDARPAASTGQDAELSTPRRGMLLTRFAARRAAAGGVSVQVLRAGARKTLRNAFMARLRSGDTGVMQRRPNEGRKIKVLYGPSPDQVFFRLRPDYRVELEEDLLRDLESRLNRVL